MTFDQAVAVHKSPHVARFFTLTLRKKTTTCSTARMGRPHRGIEDTGTAATAAAAIDPGCRTAFHAARPSAYSFTRLPTCSGPGFAEFELLVVSGVSPLSLIGAVLTPFGTQRSTQSSRDLAANYDDKHTLTARKMALFDLSALRCSSTNCGTCTARGKHKGLLANDALDHRAYDGAMTHDTCSPCHDQGLTPTTPTCDCGSVAPHVSKSLKKSLLSCSRLPSNSNMLAPARDDRSSVALRSMCSSTLQAASD